MRPILKPGLQVLVRDAQTVQIGLDPRRAVLVTGSPEATIGLLNALDGTRDTPGVLTWAAANEVPLDDVVALLARLRAGGLLIDALAEHPLAERDRATRERLAPDADAVGLLDDDEPHAMSRRYHAHVVVEGAGRLGAAIAHLLAASGVGRVGVVDDATVSLTDVSPAGHRFDAIGRSRLLAVHDALGAWGARAATLQQVRRPRARAARGATRQTDVVVLTTPEACTPHRRAELLLGGQTHVTVRVQETVGEVGPLVVPGSSACAGCVELHRVDRDRGWSAVARCRAEHEEIGETLLVTMTAALAAAAVTAHLDGRGDSPVVDGTVEVSLPFGLTTLRRWRPHPACGCRWDLLGGRLGDRLADRFGGAVTATSA
ncbi:MAG: ThiF family adenylyltransferase [Candidatus Nanopelagicales bacterium]